MDTGIKRHQPLYLKYRPQSLGQLVGQEAVRRTLTNAITQKRISHAYLFTGPRGTGKTSTARILAKSLNCLSTGDPGEPTLEPCQTCACCLEITAGTSPAVLEIDAASNNSVDDARVLIEKAPLKAVGGRFKIYIIDECHMLTKEAFNALLKTIEQPPPGVVFVLATTEEHKVLPTIVSRCQRSMFRLINQDSLVEHLSSVAKKEEINIEPEAVKLIARRSGGGLRDALGHLDQASLLATAERAATIEDLLRLIGALNEDALLSLSQAIYERDGKQLLEMVDRLLQDGREPPVVVQELQRHFLHMAKLHYLIGEPGAAEKAEQIIPGSQQYIQGLLEQAPQYDRAELSAMIEALDRLTWTVKSTTQPMMQLEIGLLGLCHRQDLPLVRELTERVARLEAMLAGGAVPSQPAHRDHSSTRPAPVAARPPVPPAPARHVPAQPAPTAPPAATAPTQPEMSISVVQSEAAIPAPKVTEAAADDEYEYPSGQPDDEGEEAGYPPAPAQPAQPAPQPQTAPPAPAKPAVQKAAAVPAADTDDGPQMNADELEGLWSDLLNELHRRHLPTYSLVSTAGFPLNINAAEIVVGVYKENFQKMLESKAEHLKAAAQVVLGATPVIRVRVAAGKAPAKVATARPAKPPSQDRYDSPPSHNEPQANQPRSQTAGEPSPASEGEPEQATSQSRLGEDETDSTMVKEAYKLFEGPGSRRIT